MRPLSFAGASLSNTPIMEWFAAAKIEPTPELGREADQIATVLRNHHFMRQRTPQAGIVRGEDIFAGAPGMSSQMSSSSFINMLPYVLDKLVSRVGPAPDPLTLPLLIAGWFVFWLVVIAIVMWL